MKKYIFALFCAFLLVACEEIDIAGMLNNSSPQVDDRFFDSMKWNGVYGYTSVKVPNDYKVYVCTDSHVEEGKDSNLKRFVNDYKSDSECFFAIHLGDLINKKNNQALCASDLALTPEGYVQGKDTIFTIAGNHDLYFNQWGAYLQYFHNSAYYVETVSQTSGKKLDFYIFLDTASGTLGEKQTKWLRQLLEDSRYAGYRHTFICSHTHFFERDHSQFPTSNFALEETYMLTTMFSKYNVDMVLTGHDHNWENTLYGNVRYLTLDALKNGPDNAAYTILSVGDDIKFDVVKLQ